MSSPRRRPWRSSRTRGSAGSFLSEGAPCPRCGSTSRALAPPWRTGTRMPGACGPGRMTFLGGDWRSTASWCRVVRRWFPCGCSHASSQCRDARTTCRMHIGSSRTGTWERWLGTILVHNRASGAHPGQRVAAMLWGTGTLIAGGPCPGGTPGGLVADPLWHRGPRRGMAWCDLRARGARVSRGVAGRAWDCPWSRRGQPFLSATASAIPTWNRVRWRVPRLESVHVSQGPGQALH